MKHQLILIILIMRNTKKVLKGSSLEFGKEIYVDLCFEFPSTYLVQFQGSVGMQDYSITDSIIQAFLEQYQHQVIDFIMQLLEKASRVMLH